MGTVEIAVEARLRIKPYNYEGVSDAGLKRFLELFEENVVQKQTEWPVDSKKAVSLVSQFSIVHRPQGPYISSIYDLVCRVHPLNLIKNRPGEQRCNYFNQDLLRAFAAIVYVSSMKDVTRKNLIPQTKRVLGINGLAEKIILDARTLPRPNPPKASTHKQGGEREEDPETVKEKVGAESRINRLSNRIPSLDPEETESAKRWNREELEQLLDRIPAGSIDEFSFLKIPVEQHIPKVVMFIYAFDRAFDGNMRDLRGFDSKLDGLTFRAFREGIKACLVFFKEYPQLNNLAELFGEVGERVRKMDNR